MSHVAQLDTSLSRELGVLSQYLDREGNLVDNALAPRLHLIPKFQVTWLVISALPIFVVNSFAVFKRTAKNFFHYGAVGKNFAPASQVKAPVAVRENMPVGVYWAPAAPFVPAFRRAEFLSLVVTGVLAVLRTAKTSFFGYTTKLALKCRRGFAVHEASLNKNVILVKEKV